MEEGGFILQYIKEIYKINKEDLPKDSYLNNIPFVKNFNGIKIEKPVTFFVGENGSGKSTLLEALAIAIGLNPEGGSKNFNFATKETHSELGSLLEIARGPAREDDGFFLRAESFYNLATEVDNLESSGFESFYDSYGGKSLHMQSHGESFRSLVLNRFRGKGIYLLDEPEAALSPTSIMSLLCIIHELEKDDSQFFIATHSPILLAFPDAEIFEFNENGLEKKTYKETESYNITKTFLDNPEKMLNLLFEKDL